jgi:hypothetical protein
MGHELRWERKTLYCPHCERTVEAIPIAYGFPAPKLIEAAERREVLLGGCALEREEWGCPDCRHPIPRKDESDWDRIMHARQIARPNRFKGDEEE